MSKETPNVFKRVLNIFIKPMSIKFKNKLIGKRIVLKRVLPTIKNADMVFKVVDSDRQHLKRWVPWEKTTKTIEDYLKYLLDTDNKTKKGEKIDYGIFLNDEYIGNTGVFDIDTKNRSAEIGFWLCSRFTRNGYATEAVKILEKEFFENFKLNRIQIRCDDTNKASAGVAKKCGYKFEGKLREDAFDEYRKEFRSTLVFSKLRAEYKK